jgi:pilus assembly protein CpaE
MASVLRTVLIDGDAESLSALRRMLASSSSAVIVGEFGSVAEALVEAPVRRPDLIIVEIPARHVAEGPEAASRLVAELTKALPETAVFATGRDVSADCVIRLMRAGAVEFLTRPVERDDLVSAFEKLARFRRGGGADRKPGRVTALYSTKGGVGVTTVATNLAVCLAQRGANTLLLDLDTRQSDVATFLNLRSTYSVLDAFENVGRMDESFLRGLLTRHTSGLWVLPGPSRIERIQFGAEPVRVGVEIMRSHFDHVLLDLRHDLDAGTVAALEAADTILFLTSLDVPAVRSTAAGVAGLRGLGVSSQKIRIVVMRDETSDEVTSNHVRDALDMPVFWKVPNDYQTNVSSINAGEPVVTASPRSKLARSFMQLAEWVAQSRSGGSAAPAKRPFSLRRLVWNPKQGV